MNNHQLKQYAEGRFNARTDADKVKWAQVLATCLQTESIELIG